MESTNHLKFTSTNIQSQTSPAHTKKNTEETYDCAVGQRPFKTHETSHSWHSNDFHFLTVLCESERVKHQLETCP